MELPAARDNQFLFLDMNAFFASCEQHRQPELRGQPVAVTPTLAPTGCIVAASYEAKRYGVYTGCTVKEAQRRVPSIKIVETHHQYYADIHFKIAAFIETEITPNPLRLSVDEFGLPLDKREQWTPNAHALALHIKQRMAAIFSPALKCSIGIGPNMFLAKLGTEVQKPDGLVTIQLHTLAQTYAMLKLRDIPGINWGMSHRLHGLGVRTPLEFYGLSRETLHKAFGISGDAWWYNLRGYRVDRHESPTKSVSHSHVLAPRLRTKTEARAVLYKLFLKVIERLRGKHLATRKIGIYIKDSQNNRAWWHYEIALRPTQDVFGIFRVIARAYDTQLAPTFAPLKILVVAFRLEPYSPSWLGVFPEDNQRRDFLFQAIDKINTTHGRWTIRPASLLPIHDSAPNRITFRTPDYAMD